MAGEAFFRGAEPSSILELLEALRAPGAPAGGSALAYAAAMAAALAEMCVSPLADASELRAATERLAMLAERDARAYRAYQEATGPERAAAVGEAMATPLAIAREARAVWERLAPFRSRVSPPRRADVDVALDLLRVAARGAARLARFNARAAGAAGRDRDAEAREVEAWADTATVSG